MVSPRSNSSCSDSAKLRLVSHEVALGTIAHEIAHVALGHPRIRPDEYAADFEAYEYAADDLGREWGFTEEIDEMRHKYGPPTQG